MHQTLSVENLPKLSPEPLNDDSLGIPMIYYHDKLLNFYAQFVVDNY